MKETAASSPAMTCEEATSLRELGRAARLDPGPDADAWAERLDSVQERLRLAVEWFAREGDADSALVVASRVWRLWWRKGELEEGRRMLATAIDAARDRKPTLELSKALYADGQIAFRQGCQDQSRERNEAALHAAVAVGDAAAQALALVGLSRVAFRAGDHHQVCALAQRARELVSDAPERARTMPLHLHAAGTRLLGDYDRARALYMESLEMGERLGDRHLVRMEHHNLGFVEIHRGDAEAARAHFAACADLHDPSNRVDRALEHLRRAALALLDGRESEAARELASGEATLREAGIVLDPDDQFEADWLDASLRHAGPHP